MSTQTEARISALPLYGRVVLVVVTEEDGEAVTRSHVLPVEAARYLAGELGFAAEHAADAVTGEPRC
jgi:hypothetical protein